MLDNKKLYKIIKPYVDRNLNKTVIYLINKYSCNDELRDDSIEDISDSFINSVDFMKTKLAISYENLNQNLNAYNSLKCENLKKYIDIDLQFCQCCSKLVNFLRMKNYIYIKNNTEKINYFGFVHREEILEDLKRIDPFLKYLLVLENEKYSFLLDEILNELPYFYEALDLSAKLKYNLKLNKEHPLYFENIMLNQIHNSIANQCNIAIPSEIKDNSLLAGYYFSTYQFDKSLSFFNNSTNYEFIDKYIILLYRNEEFEKIEKLYSQAKENLINIDKNINILEGIHFYYKKDYENCLYYLLKYVSETTDNICNNYCYLIISKVHAHLNEIDKCVEYLIKLDNSFTLTDNNDIDECQIKDLSNDNNMTNEDIINYKLDLLLNISSVYYSIKLLHHSIYYSQKGILLTTDIDNFINSNSINNENCTNISCKNYKLQFWRIIGKIYYKESRFEESCYYFQLAVNNGDSHSLLYLAEIYKLNTQINNAENIDNKQRVIDCYKKYLSEVKDNSLMIENVKKYLMEYYVEIGYFEEAKEFSVNN